MSGIKFLLKNIGLLTISQFSSKILSFLLVPLYTSVLSTEEYGIYGIYSTTISLLVPILTLNLSEAALRFSLDKKYEKNKIFSFCLKYILVGTTIICCFTIVNSIFNIVPMLVQFSVYFVLMFITTAMNCLIMAFARGIEKINALAISGFIGTVGVLFFNIFFLLTLHQGLKGYFLANILGTTVQMLCLTVALQLWKYITLKRDNNEYKREMIHYSMPLVGNSVSWWINDASDRYIVTWMCGVEQNGIYSVGYKIPSILNVFQSIFSQAWTLSAVKEYESDNKETFFSKTYTIYSFFMTSACLVLIIFDKQIASILYAKEFFEAWKYVPPLLIATLFGALSGHIGGIFAAVKDTKAYATTTIVGAVCNIVLNLLFIRVIGVMGAAIATLAANIVVWMLRYIKARQYIKMDIYLSGCTISYLLLGVQSMILYITDKVDMIWGSGIIIFLLIMLVYRKEIIICKKMIDVALEKVKKNSVR